MWKNDRNKLLYLPKRYPCLDSFIIVSFYTTMNTVLILGVMVCIQSLAIGYRALVDMNLLMSYLQMDFIYLFCGSILTIISGSLGVISGYSRSKSGLLTSMGLLLITLLLIDGYALGFRVKDYISKSHLNNILYEAINKSPLENFQFHFMQKMLSCCGVSHYSDWIIIHKGIPGSCCNNMTICNDNDPNLYKIGCSQVISEILQYTFQTTVNIIIVVNVFLILGFFSSTLYRYLMLQLKKAKKIPFVALPRPVMTLYSINQQNIDSLTIDPNTIQSGNNGFPNNNYGFYNAYASNENNNASQQVRNVTFSEDLIVQDENNTPQEETNTAQEETNPAQEETNTVQEETNAAQEETNTVQEETNTAQEETNSAQEKTNTAQEENSSSHIYSSAQSANDKKVVIVTL
ncbi:hypothetical protein M0802_000002 [Mischocyttarus mexicanus]|nr:hypothetical protein M0802_000002 [Mischocyttarus mexicanus]